MKIKNKVTESITTESYEVECDGTNGPMTFIYIDYLNEKGKVIDSVLRTVEGYDVDVPGLMEEIQEFIDQNA